MSNGTMDELREKFADFIDKLGEKDVREQLLLSYLQMERCMEVLRGKPVEPVSMKDNGESSDLELFYLCKKKAKEISLLELKNAPDYTSEFDYTDYADIFRDWERNIPQPLYHIHDELCYLADGEIKLGVINGIDYRAGTYLYHFEGNYICSEQAIGKTVNEILSNLEKLYHSRYGD